MVFDSDSIGAANPTVSLIEGYLTSPVINCTGHSTVQVKFQQYFRRFNDSCYLDVSTNNFGTFTRFPVLPNNTIAGNAFLPSNPYTTYMNITSAAANNANVRIRFYYKCTVAQGGYNWLVDDIEVSELDAVELGIDNSSFIMTLRDPDLGITSFNTYPKQLVDTIYPVTFLSNFGLNAQNTAGVQARIFRGNAATPVYNQSVVYNTPVGAIDSSIDFRTIAAGGYLPTDTGLYTIAFSVNQTGDAIADNNIDTTRFRLTDSVLTMSVGARTSSWEVQAPASGGDPVLYRQVGTWFEIPAGKSDTLSAVSVAFANGTTAGSNVGVQIYKLQAGGNPTGANANYDFVGETSYKALTTAQISTATSVVSTTFQIDPSVSVNPTDLVLTGGFYAAVVRGQGNPATNTIALVSYQSPAFGFLGSYGTLDTADNQQFSYNYGANGNGHFVFTLGNSVPFIRPIFGKLNMTSVSDVAVATLGAAYPNPANTKVNIPVSLSNASDVSVTLSTATGQVIARQQLGKQTAGRGFEISFPTGNLANGVYFYTMEAAGEKQSGRIAVTH